MAETKSDRLLKNAGSALPLRKHIGKIAVVGPHANSTTALQSNYHGTAPYIVSPAEGLGKYGAIDVAPGCQK